MNPLDLCTRETVEIATYGGPTKMPAWRFADLACHRGIASRRSVWVITHLPTGLGFSSVGVFDNAEDASAAMIEVAKLRNSWLLNQEDLPRLQRDAAKIFSRHNAKPDDGIWTRRSPDRSVEMLSVRLNGYDNDEVSA